MWSSSLFKTRETNSAQPKQKGVLDFSSFHKALRQAQGMPQVVEMTAWL